MTWNWQKTEWPHFRYDSALLDEAESAFLAYSGKLSLGFQHLAKSTDNDAIVELLTSEAMKTSEIEGEYLDRKSVRSSILKTLGKTAERRYGHAESGIADLLLSVFKNWEDKLNFEMFSDWHKMLCRGRDDLHTIGNWRNNKDDMHVISGYYGKEKIHFTAPPSNTMDKEMKRFIDWYNNESKSLRPLTRAGLVHLYFVSIHPFEDGNGRVSRALCEKSLCQSLNSRSYICISSQIMKDRDRYYSQLEDNNRNLNVDAWLKWFANTILLSVKDSEEICNHVLFKTRMFDRINDKINERQKKVILRMFEEGPKGFEGGLSAENYITIAKISRQTATRDLNHLMGVNALNRTGEGKGTRYWLNKNEKEIF